MSGRTPPTVALAGRPNTGKTTLFNALTGLRQRVANFSGTTVEKAVGLLEREAARAEIIDLPGMSSIFPQSEDEAQALAFLRDQASTGANLHVLCLAEASNLENDLPLPLTLAACGYRVTVVVNMIDEAVINGIRIDAQGLAAELGLPVILASARTGQGLASIVALIEGLGTLADSRPAPAPAGLKELYQQALRQACRAASRCVKREGADLLPTLSRSIALDRRLFHPVAGPLILGAILLLVFEALFSGAAPIQDAIASFFDAGAAAVKTRLGAGLLSSLLCDGIIGGFSAVLQFIPQIAILFLLIGFLEQSGYLPRAGVMVDRALRPFGLDGKVFLPFLSSFACAIPGVMAARTIPNGRRRLTAILLAPLMTCSARLPVYALVIGAFVPKDLQVMGLSAQALTMGGMYLLGVAMALALALALKAASFHEKNPSPVTSLPPYRFPRPLELARYSAFRCWHFAWRAGRVIFALSLALWLLGNFPRDEKGVSSLETSALGAMGRAIEPVFAPLGYDWRLSIAVLSSLAAREVFVGTLGTIYAIESGSDPAKTLTLGETLRQARAPDGSPRYTLATAISLLIFFAIALQCISTLAVVRRETGGWKWPALQFAAFFAIAYGLSWTAYRLATVLLT